MNRNSESNIFLKRVSITDFHPTENYVNKQVEANGFKTDSFRNNS